MKSAEYWQKRAEARMSRGIASADEVLSQLERAYAKAAREVQGDIRRLYERYGDEYGLSYADAIKDIEQSAYKEWRMTLADYVERINATGDAELLRELNTLSARARVTRLQTLEAAVKVSASELATKVKRLSRSCSAMPIRALITALHTTSSVVSASARRWKCFLLVWWQRRSPTRGAGRTTPLASGKTPMRSPPR